MWSSSSSSTGLPSRWSWLLAFYLLLIPCATSWPQDSPSVPQSSVSSNDFLQAVRELSADLSPTQLDKLTTILMYYADREKKQNESIKRLSASWQVEKDKIRTDQLWGAFWSGLGGFLASFILIH